MTNDQPILIFTETEKPKNCNIRIDDMKVFYQISINKKQFDSLNEDDKIECYYYSPDWSNVKKYQPEEIKRFSQDEKDPSQLLYFKGEQLDSVIL
jgi:hypothetical protein